MTAKLQQAHTHTSVDAAKHRSVKEELTSQKRYKARPRDKKARRESRVARIKSLEAAASSVELPDLCDVCIVGGGAAGLVAAIAAAETGADVVVIESNLECGRSILATGGGRCNFANTQLCAAHYNNPQFVDAVCGPQWLDDILAFFEESGLAWITEQDRLYPASLQAASVRDLLLKRAERAHVRCACAQSCSEIRPLTASKQSEGGLWELSLSSELLGDRQLLARSVILANGATTSPQGHGLAIKPPVPVLCPLACVGLPFRELNGRRARVRASLIRKRQLVASDCGELLFRDYGVSGIVIFNLSRFAQAQDELVVDLVPEFSVEKLEELVKKSGTLAGVVDPVIAQALTEFFAEPAQQMAARIKALSCSIVERTETEHAQVSRGGLSCDEFSPHTLMALDHPGLFACGETLDIDGECGGFNLAWAWKSGLVAGQAAATWIHKQRKAAPLLEQA